MTTNNHARRQFLGQSTRMLSIATLASTGLLALSTKTHAAVGDYKALVCVFLAGGNDGANTIIPRDPARNAAYNAIRSGSGLALSGANLSPTRIDGTQAFAFNAQLSAIDALYGQGKVAVLLNTGNLSKPTTKAEYQAGTSLPGELFSHPDQQGQANAGLASASATGWGGRLLDALGTGRPLDAISVGSSGMFVQGNIHHSNLVPESGGLTLSGMNFWPQTEADQRNKALMDILAAGTGNRVSTAANKALSDGIALSKLLGAVGNTPLAATFPNHSLGNQLKTTAQLIAYNAKQGPGRQVFYVSLDGFDTHGGQAWSHADLMGKLGTAMAAFQAAISGAGLDKQVTMFTSSEFGRTLSPNSTGTDHGWGSHAMVVGGAVKGGLYGSFPDFTLGGPDDATSRGTWIPKIGVQQMGATLGMWFGADATTLDKAVFPNELKNFVVKDLGFMG
ncbi:MAG: DUF1501 domain-containing protein [Candidatus Saccharibacteria bacterium]|nr:DUF1501 domain-containing protein [Rhodoferax sp.]